VTYGSNLLSAEEFAILEAQTNSVSQCKYSYMIQIEKDVYIDSSGEQGGVLRIINNSLSQKLTNCEFYCHKGEIKVRTTKVIQSECEQFLTNIKLLLAICFIQMNCVPCHVCQQEVTATSHKCIKCGNAVNFLWRANRRRRIRTVSPLLL
jgi:hypothetical protein